MISKKYNSIDLAKIFMAICVVAIHTEPLHDCSCTTALNIYSAVVRLAVPFFFIASGFLMAGKFDDDFSGRHNRDIVKKSLFRTIKLYVIWTAVYLPMTIWHFCHEDASFFHQCAVFIRGFLFVGEQYNSWPLWYLLASIYALVLIWLLMKLRIGRNGLLIAGTVCLFISIFLSWFFSYEGALPSALASVRYVIYNTILNSRILTGAFYIPVGICIRNRKLPLPVCALLFVLGSAANVITGSEWTVTIAIAAIGLFGLVSEIRLKDNGIYPRLRKMSTVIYFIHMYLWTAYYMLVYRTKTYGPDSFLATALAAVLISLVYCAISDRSAQKSKAAGGL